MHGIRKELLEQREREERDPLALTRELAGSKKCGPDPSVMKFLKILAVLAASALSVKAVSAEEVYFLRGGFDIFSTGMNEMARELRAKKVNASAHSFMAWQSIANDIVKRSKEKKVSYPIIVLGHSFGADVVADFANFLGQNGVTTELVIGFDATGTRSFGKGVKKVVNYRLPRGGRYVRGEGFRGTISEIDAAKFGVNHFNLEQTEEVQNSALATILSALKRRR